jgi:hypothetical protein
MGLFIDKLGMSGDRVGVVAYAGEVVGYLPLVSLTDEDAQSALRLFITGLNYAGWTDHSPALEKAVSLLSESEYTDERERMVLLLTDGNMDIAPHTRRTYADAQADLERVIGQAIINYIPIYTVGLNHDGTLNRAYIEHIAQTTGGQAFETASADALPDIIGEILNDKLSLHTAAAYQPTVNSEERQPIENAAQETNNALITTDVEIPHMEANDSAMEAVHIFTDVSPEQSKLTIWSIMGGAAGMVILSGILLFLCTRRASRVFTGRLIVESANTQPQYRNLIQYGKRTTLRALLNGEKKFTFNPHLDKIALTPSPKAPSHRPQLLLVCKHPRITFRKDFTDLNAKKGLYISPGTELTIQLPDDYPDIRLRYVA